MSADPTNNPMNTIPDTRQNPISEKESLTMTATLTEPTTTAPGKIDQGINKRVNDSLAEMNDLIKERADVLHGAWVAAVAQEHVLMLGPGGTGKSMLVRAFTDHVEGAKLFETAFDETTDPSQVFGPPDIKAMVEIGKTRRVVDNMLPEAHIAFLDEFFNGNNPLLHSIMPILNERVFHNNGMPSRVPLRSCFMGTNKLNADADQAALWDRVHLRYTVNYIQERGNQVSMMTQAIARMAKVGRGTSTSIADHITKVSVAELDQAHKEALALDIPESVITTFLDIRDELQHGAKIQISDRRMNEGMAAVLANAWVRNHEEVKVGDLDILAAMWWTVQDQQAAARNIIMTATNPTEKAALDLLDQLDKFKAEAAEAMASGMDDTRKTRVGVGLIRNTTKLLADADTLLKQAQGAGTGTTRIEEVIAKADRFKVSVGNDFWNLGNPA